jgi:hypothetical protein
MARVKTGDPFIDAVYDGIETRDMADENGEYPLVFQCPKCRCLPYFYPSAHPEDGIVCPQCKHVWVPEQEG